MRKAPDEVWGFFVSVLNRSFAARIQSRRYVATGAPKPQLAIIFRHGALGRLVSMKNTRWPRAISALMTIRVA